MNHTITYKTWRGRRSASCSCGQRWPKVGYSDTANLAGANAMLRHAREARAVVREAGAHVMGSRQAPAVDEGQERQRNDAAMEEAQGI